MFGARNRRLLILTGYAAVWIVLALIWEGFVVPALLLAFPRFRLWLYRLFVGQADCPTCGKTTPLVGSWRCGGCGFVQRRHAYEPCAKCGSGIAEMPCPHCDHGMFL